jgi:hypothetical protein
MFACVNHVMDSIDKSFYYWYLHNADICSSGQVQYRGGTKSVMARCCTFWLAYHGLARFHIFHGSSNEHSMPHTQTNKQTLALGYHKMDGWMDGWEVNWTLGGPLHLLGAVVESAQSPPESTTRHHELNTDTRGRVAFRDNRLFISSENTNL